MQFTFQRRPPSAPVTSNAFRVGALWAANRGDLMDVSHLVDQTYDYHSERELRWHLAERFSVPVGAVTLSLA